MTKLRYASHANQFVVAYPAETPDQSMGGVQLAGHGRLSDRDLKWLLEQPGLPEEFRRAAAVHLQP